MALGIVLEALDGEVGGAFVALKADVNFVGVLRGGQGLRGPHLTHMSITVGEVNGDKGKGLAFMFTSWDKGTGLAFLAPTFALGALAALAKAEAGVH